MNDHFGQILSSSTHSLLLFYNQTIANIEAKAGVIRCCRCCFWWWRLLLQLASADTTSSNSRQGCLNLSGTAARSRECFEIAANLASVCSTPHSQNSQREPKQNKATQRNATQRNATQRNAKQRNAKQSSDLRQQSKAEICDSRQQKVEQIVDKTSIEAHSGSACVRRKVSKFASGRASPPQSLFRLVGWTWLVVALSNSAVLGHLRTTLRLVSSSKPAWRSSRK